MAIMLCGCLRVPVPHEGLEGGDRKFASKVGEGFPFPMRGWKSRNYGARTAGARVFPFPMRGWKSIRLGFVGDHTRVPVPHEGLEAYDSASLIRHVARFPFPMR